MCGGAWQKRQVVDLPAWRAGKLGEVHLYQGLVPGLAAPWLVGAGQRAKGEKMVRSGWRSCLAFNHRIMEVVRRVFLLLHSVPPIRVLDLRP